MKFDFIIAGFGGQGILSLGKIICLSVIKDGMFATYFPSYGAEMRGGTANCKVRISHQEIASPYVVKADVLVVFNKPSWEKFRGKLENKGFVFVNKDIISSIDNRHHRSVFYGDFSARAKKIGLEKAANIVALGKIWKELKFARQQSVLWAIKNYLNNKKSIVDINLAAFKEGKKI